METQPVLGEIGDAYAGGFGAKGAGLSVVWGEQGAYCLRGNAGAVVGDGEIFYPGCLPGLPYDVTIGGGRYGFHTVGGQVAEDRFQKIFVGLQFKLRRAFEFDPPVFGVRIETPHFGEQVADGDGSGLGGEMAHLFFTPEQQVFHGIKQVGGRSVDLVPVVVGPFGREQVRVFFLKVEEGDEVADRAAKVVAQHAE